MAKIRFEQSELESEEGETVLETLLRHGLDVPSSCRSGVCQSCLLRCLAGTPSARSQEGLKETLRVQGYFLPCQCQPQGPLTLSRGSVEDLFVTGRIVERRMLAARIVQLFVETSSPLHYRAGQFVGLRRPDGLVRSYSLASDPSCSKYLELHVTRLDGGTMSSWLYTDCGVGQEVLVRGPSGDCFYVPGRPAQPILLIGTGTGLAPLLGIVRSALSAGHTGDMLLYHGSYDASGLYFVDELRAMASRHEQLHYHPCVDRDDGSGLRTSRAHEAALSDHPSLTGFRVFLCGHPGMVKTMRKRAYLAGAKLGDILADAFEVAPHPTARP